MSKVGPKKSTDNMQEDEIRVKPTGSTVIKVGGGLPKQPEAEKPDKSRKEIKTAKSRNLSKTADNSVPAAAAALESKLKTNKKSSESKSVAKSDKENSKSDEKIVEYGVVTGTTPIPPPPPMPKTTHFASTSSGSESGFASAAARYGQYHIVFMLTFSQSRIKAQSNL